MYVFMCLFFLMLDRFFARFCMCEVCYESACRCGAVMLRGDVLLHYVYNFSGFA